MKNVSDNKIKFLVKKQFHSPLQKLFLNFFILVKTLQKALMLWDLCSVSWETI